MHATELRYFAAALGDKQLLSVVLSVSSPARFILRLDHKKYLQINSRKIKQSVIHKVILI